MINRPHPDDHALRDSVVETLLKGVNYYLASTRGAWVWRVPEGWMRDEVKRRLYARYKLNIWPEFKTEMFFKTSSRRAAFGMANSIWLCIK